MARGPNRNYRELIRDKTPSNDELRVDYKKRTKRWRRVSSLFITTHLFTRKYFLKRRYRCRVDDFIVRRVKKPGSLEKNLKLLNVYIRQ